MNRKNIAVIAFSLLALIVLAWAAWPEPQAVETASLRRGDFVRELVEDAQTRVRERYTVAAPLSGQLQRPTIKAGDALTPADVVATIEPAAAAFLDTRSQGEQHERVAAMQATLDRALANHQRARAAQAQAEADHQRIRSLATQGFVSSSQLENAALALQQKQQEAVMAQQERDAARHDLARLRIGLWQPADRKSQALWRVRSPVAGRVLKLHRDSEGPVTAGAALVDIGDPDQLEIVTELLTEDAAGLPVQAQATLAHWGGNGLLQARLSRIEAGAFTKVSALGVEEQRVRAVFNWLGPAPAGLGDGFKMEIRIAVQQAHGVPLAPVSAVFPHGQSHAVFVVERGRVRLQPVTLMGRNGQLAWLQTQLAEGAVLVAYPPATLRAGDRVRPLDGR